MGVYTVNQTDGSLQRVAGGTLYADAPIGAIQSYGGETAPAGWLICDGSAVSRTEYAELFAVIGINFGEGDGETTFGIPDLRECVPVGAGKNITKSIANHDRYDLGQFRDDALGTHNHPLVSVTTATFNTAGVPVGIGNNNTPTSATHGKQLGVNYIIKAKMVAIPADFLAKVDEVCSGKADKVSSATAGNIATLDANGNLVDSGVVASNVIRRVTPSTAVDCNDLTDIFTEYRVGNGDANRPTTDAIAYSIRTFKTNDTSTICSQIAYSFSNTGIYRRNRNSSGVWSSWQKLVTESDFKKERIISGLKLNANTFTTNVSTWITNGVVRLTVTDSRNAEICAVYFARVFNSIIIALYPVITGHRAMLSLNADTIAYDDSAGLSSTNDGRVYLEVIENDY